MTTRQNVCNLYTVSGSHKHTFRFISIASVTTENDEKKIIPLDRTCEAIVYQILYTAQDQNTNIIAQMPIFIQS